MKTENKNAIWKAPALRFQRTVCADGPILRGDMLADFGGDVRVEAGVDGTWFHVIDENGNAGIFTQTETGWDQGGDVRVLEKLSDSDLSSILRAFEEAAK